MIFLAISLLGCHQIGSDLKLKQFLEDYAGCEIVSMEHPERKFEDESSPKGGWYFAHGCYQLIEHLLELIRAAEIVIRTETKVQSASIDPQTKIATLMTEKGTFSAQKLILTPLSSVPFGSPPPQNYTKTKYYHLYLLVQDPTPYRFTYRQGVSRKSSRLMNLTPFVDLTHTGRQLIVIQTRNEKELYEEIEHLEAIKKENLLDPSAYILQSERYIYESGSLNQSQIPFKESVEILQTGHFNNLNNYISRWTSVLKPYREALSIF